MTKERFKLMPAVSLLIKKNDKILLQKRKNTGWEDGKWSLIGGGVDGSETILQAVIREAKEELDITVRKDDLKVAHVLHYRNENGGESITFFLEITQWDGEPRIMEPDKCEAMQWFELDNLPENTVSPLKTTLTRIRNKIMYGEWGWD